MGLWMTRGDGVSGLPEVSSFSEFVIITDSAEFTSVGEESEVGNWSFID